MLDILEPILTTSDLANLFEVKKRGQHFSIYSLGSVSSKNGMSTLNWTKVIGAVA